MRASVFSLFKVVFGVVFASIFVTLLFFSHWSYACKRTFLIPNQYVLMIIMGLFLLTLALRHYIKDFSVLKKLHSINVDRVVYLLVAVLFLFQCYVCYNIFFTAGWDARAIDNALQSILKHEGYSGDYFSIYPNNLVILYIHLFIHKVNNCFGVFNGEYRQMCIVIVNCMINSLSCLLTYKTARIFVSRKVSFFAFCLAISSFGISAWSVIPYSDALMLFAPILSIYLYCKHYNNERSKVLGIVGAIAVSTASYFVKPYCAIVGIAILLVEFVCLFENFSARKIMRPVGLCLVAILTVICISFTTSLCNQRYGIQVDKNKTFGMSHFLMMGANEQRGGVWSGDDVKFSMSFSTYQERQTANLEVFKQRVGSMGIGFVNHLQKKMLTTFNDGTFAWGAEGSFYASVPKDLNYKVAPLLKSIYYNKGIYYPYLSSFQHFIWLIILLFSFATVLVNKNFRYKRQFVLMWIVISGFVLYELFFEVRARYIYDFIPVLCTMAVVGFQRASELTLNLVPHIVKAFKRRKSI